MVVPVYQMISLKAMLRKAFFDLWMICRIYLAITCDFKN